MDKWKGDGYVDLEFALSDMFQCYDTNMLLRIFGGREQMPNTSVTVDKENDDSIWRRATLTITNSDGVEESCRIIYCFFGAQCMIKLTYTGDMQVETVKQETLIHKLRNGGCQE